MPLFLLLPHVTGIGLGDHIQWQTGTQGSISLERARYRNGRKLCPHRRPWLGSNSFHFAYLLAHSSLAWTFLTHHPLKRLDHYITHLTEPQVTALDNILFSHDIWFFLIITQATHLRGCLLAVSWKTYGAIVPSTVGYFSSSLSLSLPITVGQNSYSV